jgi:hypothetical protein
LIGFGRDSRITELEGISLLEIRGSFHGSEAGDGSGGDLSVANSYSLDSARKPAASAVFLSRIALRSIDRRGRGGMMRAG